MEQDRAVELLCFESHCYLFDRLGALLDQIPTVYTTLLGSLSLTRQSDLVLDQELSHPQTSQIFLIALDLMDGNGIEAITAVKRVAPKLPVVALLKDDEQALAADCMQAGAVDVLLVEQCNGTEIGRLLYHLIRKDEKQQEQEKLFNLLNSISQTAVAPGSINTLLQTVATNLTEIMGATGCHITLWDDLEELPIPIAASGEHRDTFLKTRVNPGEKTLSAAVLKAGHALVVENAAENPFLDEKLSQRFQEERTLLGLPLIANENKLGVIILAYPHPHHFTADEIKNCEQITANIAQVLAYANALEMEREQRELAESLRNSGIALVATLDFEALLEKLLEQVARVVPFDTAIVMLEEKGKARVVSQRGYEQLGDEISQKVASLSFQIATTPTLRKLVETREPFIIPDISDFSEWVHLDASAYIRSWAGVPITYGDKILALLSVNKREPGFYQAKHMARLEAFAAQAGLALQNANLFQSVQRQLDELSILNELSQMATAVVNEDDLITLATEIIGKTLYPHNFGVLLWDEESGRILTHSSYKVKNSSYFVPSFTKDQGIVGEVIRRAAPLRVPDVSTHPHYVEVDRNTRSELAVPMLVGNRIIGVINAEWPTINGFTAADERLLTTIAGQLGTAIEKIRLFNLESDRRRFAEVLRQATNALNSSLNLDEVLQQIFEQMNRLIDFDDASIMLSQNDGLQLVAVFGFQSRISELGKMFPIDNPLYQIIHETKKPLILQNARHDERFMGWENSANVLGWLGAPLIVRGTVIGLLTLDSYEEGFFAEADAELVLDFAQQAAVAIDNAHLYEAELQARRVAETLQAANQALTQFLHLDDVLETMLDYLFELVPCDSASIFLMDEEGDDLQLSAFRNLVSEVDLRELSTQLSKLKESKITQQLYHDKKGFIIHNTAAEEDWIVLSQLSYVQCWLGVPLVVAGKVIGILTVDSTTPDHFNSHHLMLTSSLAAQASIAIKNAQLFTKSERDARESRSLNNIFQLLSANVNLLEMLPKIESIIRKITQCEFVHLLVIDENQEDGQIYRVVGTQLNEGFPIRISQLSIAEYIQKNQAQFIEDISVLEKAQSSQLQLLPTVKSFMMLPLQVENKTVGAFNVMWDDRTKYSLAHVPFLRQVGNALALALVRKKLFEKTVQQKSDLELLYRLSTDIRTARNLEDMVDIILNMPIGAMNAEAVDILLLGVDTERINLYSRSPHAEDTVSSINLNENGLFANSQLERFGQLKNLKQKDWFITCEPHLPQVSQAAEGVVQLLLHGTDRVIGMMLVSKDARHEYSEDELDLLTAAAEIAGSALERALLMQTLEERVRARTQELEDANQQLQALDRMKTKFVSDVSHELRTPTTNISLYLDLLEFGKPERRESYKNVLRKQAQRLQRLIDDILNLSRLDLNTDHISLTEVSLNPIVSNIVKIHMPRVEEAGLSLDLQLTPGLPQILGEGNQLAQVVTNLLINAINYTENGRICVQTFIDEPSQQVCLRMSDSGIGIPEDELSHLFDRFYRGNQAGQSQIPGNGLGLAIVKEIVEIHCGSIHVESEPGKGSDFYIYFPPGNRLRATSK